MHDAPAPARPVLRKYSHRFFDPELAAPRKMFFKVMAMMTTIAVFVQWMTLPVYWGSLHKTPSCELPRITLDKPH